MLFCVSAESGHADFAVKIEASYTLNSFIKRKQSPHAMPELPWHILDEMAVIRSQIVLFSKRMLEATNPLLTSHLNCVAP